MNKNLKNILLLLLVISWPLHAITVEEVLENFADKLGIPTLQATFKVQLIAQSGDVREIEARAYQKSLGKVQNNRLFIFDFPPTVRGTGLLLHSYFDGRDNNMWIYLPVVKRVKRVSLESSGGGYFMGSDFTYRDLIDNDYSKMDFQLVNDQVIDGIDYFVVKAWGQTPEIQQDNGYSYILSYYRKDKSFMMKREFFDFNNDLLKIYQVEDVLEIDTYIYPNKISMENVQSGHRSLLLVTDISTEDIPDRFFTTRYLQNN
jgi:hypothetical protein